MPRTARKTTGRATVEAGMIPNPSVNGHMPTVDLQTAFRAVRQEMNAVVLERESAVDNALLALLTGQHFIMLGPAGASKSLLVRRLAQHIVGAQYFEKLLDAFSVPEQLFGPLDLIGYADRGEYLRIRKGTLTLAHLAFLDEIWKANSGILNALLTIMNERILHEVGFDPLRVPLLSLFAASNEGPQDSSLRALDDRFLLREMVSYVTEERNFVALLTAPLDATPVTTTLMLAQIQQAQQAVQTIQGSEEVLQALLTLREDLGREGIVVSDRKWRQCMRLLKAKAWLDGQGAVDVEHLSCLVHVLWTDHTKEFQTVQRLVYQIACPLALRAVELEDAAVGIYAALPKQDDGNYLASAENALLQLTDIHRQLKEESEASLSRDFSRTGQAMQTIATLHQKLRVMLFKAESRYKIQD